MELSRVGGQRAGGIERNGEGEGMVKESRLRDWDW